MSTKSFTIKTEVFEGPLDLLLGRAAEHGVRRPELTKKRNELKERAPKGLEALRTNVVELQTRVADIPARTARHG